MSLIGSARSMAAYLRNVVMTMARCEKNSCAGSQIVFSPL